MIHIDLFSGIGGFALAAERVWPDIKHIFCDNDPFCQEILEKHWPKAEIYGDIRTITNTESGQSRLSSEQEGGEDSGRGGIYILTGGFPCQPFSQAGRRKGTEDDRYLWPEMFRVIREFQPRWVVAENVAGLITWNDGMVLGQVCSDLESEGYEVQPFVIPAVAVNAPHRRDRVWIVGHSKHDGYFTTEGGKSGTKRNDSTPTKQNEMEQFERTDALRNRNENWDENWFEVATRLCRVDDGLPRRMDRNPRLKALGNAIVPQVAEEIFKAIRKVEPNQ